MGTALAPRPTSGPPNGVPEEDALALLGTLTLGDAIATLRANVIERARRRFAAAFALYTYPWGCDSHIASER